MEFLHLFLRRHFVEKPVVASENVSFIFPVQLPEILVTWSQMGSQSFFVAKNFCCWQPIRLENFVIVINKVVIASENVSFIFAVQLPEILVTWGQMGSHSSFVAKNFWFLDSQYD